MIGAMKHLSKGFWRKWRCAVDNDIYEHSFTILPSSDDPDGEVRLCDNCGLRIEFYDDDVTGPRYVWYELKAPDGATFISRASYRDVKRRLRRYLR